MTKSKKMKQDIRVPDDITIQAGGTGDEFLDELLSSQDAVVSDGDMVGGVGGCLLTPMLQRVLRVASQRA